MFSRQLLNKKEYKKQEEIKNVQGPISFHFLVKDNKKIYLFGDRHYQNPLICPNSIDIITLLNNIKNEYNLFIESGCENQEAKLNNYICEISKVVKDNPTRKVFYSDVRFTHLSFIKSVQGSLDAIIENDIVSFIINYYNFLSDDSFKYSNEILTNFEKGLERSKLNDKLNILKQKDINSYNEIYRYGNDFVNSFPIKYYNNIMRMLQDVFNKICDNNKLSNETTTDFVIRIEDEVYNQNKKPNIKIPKNVRNFINNNDNIYAFSVMLNIVSKTSGVYMDVFILSNFLLSDINNNVVYAGDYHVKVYVELLEKLGFKKEFSYTKPNTKMVIKSEQCISLGNTKLPLFS